MTSPLLSISNLDVSFQQGETLTIAAKDVSIDVYPGETVALIGESGSGKSVTALSALQLLPYPIAQHSENSSIRFDNLELVQASEKTLRSIRGNRISMIFQEPMTSLNPLHTVEKQIGEVLFLHEKLNKHQVKARVIELLELVKIPNPSERLESYPHQLSGGQRQRVMIAMALANKPDLLIADEPTTAVDVTVQAQLLELLQSLQQKLGMAILLITHDLRVVSKMASRVYVMKQGEIVESGAVEVTFSNPQHDYTRMLINSKPSGHPEPISPSACEVSNQARNLPEICWLHQGGGRHQLFD
jgi:microcin C transport system ATP-binding protein